MNDLEPEAVDRTWAERWNVFYGRRRVRKFSVADREVWLTFLPRPVPEKNAPLWSLKVGRGLLKIGFSRPPELADLDAKFQEVNGSILPPELQRLFWEAALAPLLQSLESLLGDRVALESVGEVTRPAEEFPAAIGFQAFVPAGGRHFFGHWQAEDPALDASLQHLWRQQAPLPLRRYDDLRVNYTLELGSTELPREAYEKLQEEDLILLDHYALEEGAVSHLRGLEPLQIAVVPCDGGFRVKKVQF